jgi:hypothetical protein
MCIYIENDARYHEPKKSMNLKKLKRIECKFMERNGCGYVPASGLCKKCGKVPGLM